MALHGERILIVEDETLIALSLASEITELGGNVVGKVMSVDSALDIIATTDLDGAILDVNLGGQRAFLVADALAARHVPFVFATATSREDIPARHANVPWFEKPYGFDAICQMLEGMCSRNSGE